MPHPIPAPEERAAAAELIALGLIADGDLANPELEALEKHGIARLIGVAPEALIQAVVDHCRRVLASGEGDLLRVVDAPRIEALLDRIQDAALRVTTCRAMLVLSKADGEISAPEQSLLLQALTRWNIQLEAVAG